MRRLFISALEKVDLLVHIQKIQLELDQCRTKTDDYKDDLKAVQSKNKEKDSLISKYKEEILLKA